MSYRAVQPLGAAFAYEVLEMGERLGEREAKLMVGKLPWEVAAGDLVRCRGLTVEDGVHVRQTLRVVLDELVYALVEIVEERTVAREEEVRAEPVQAFEALQVALQLEPVNALVMGETSPMGPLPRSAGRSAPFTRRSNTTL